MSDTIKIQPVKRTNFEEIKVGDKREIHAQSLATFKANLSRFRGKLTDKETYKFHYSEFVDNFCTATRIA